MALDALCAWVSDADIGDLIDTISSLKWYHLEINGKNTSKTSTIQLSLFTRLNIATKKRETAKLDAMVISSNGGLCGSPGFGAIARFITN